MSRLDQYKDFIEDLADFSDAALLETYDHESEETLDAVPAVREVIFLRGLSGDKLARIDRDVLAYIDDLEDDYVDPDDSQPLDKWWWHLAKIRAGEFPLEILAPELRKALRSDPYGAAA
jgi:hypothetical protein